MLIFLLSMKIIKMPFSGSSDGAGSAPDIVVKDLHNLLSNEAGRKCGYLIEEVDVNTADAEEAKDRIYSKIKDEKESCIIIGGDHSITLPCFKAFSETHENSGIIIFDAHPDCDDDNMPPGQNDLVSGIISQKLASPMNIILLGTRSWSSKEYEFIKKNNIMFFSMKHIFEIGIKEICDTVMENSRQWPNLYISIDIDVVDPAYAPGTGCIEAGGLSSRELIYFVQRLKLLKNLKMIDIMEINPKKDINGMTSKLGAKIVAEFC